MNESILLNFTPAGNITNATGLVIDVPPFQTIEQILFMILIVVLIQLFITLWFSRRHLSR